MIERSMAIDVAEEKSRGEISAGRKHAGSCGLHGHDGAPAGRCGPRHDDDEPASN